MPARVSPSTQAFPDAGAAIDTLALLWLRQLRYLLIDGGSRAMERRSRTALVATSTRAFLTLLGIGSWVYAVRAACQLCGNPDGAFRRLLGRPSGASTSQHFSADLKAVSPPVDLEARAVAL